VIRLAVVLLCLGGSVTSAQSPPSTPRNVRVVAGAITASQEILPGQSIQTAVDAAPPGSSFLLKAGVHRLQSVQPKNGDSFVGEEGTILSGARLLTGFTQQGAAWFVGGQTQEGGAHGECLASAPRCDRREELFVDSVRQRHVGSLSAVGPGSWFFDYGADRIYIGTNPAGHVVETSVTAAAFTGNAANVMIQRLTIEKYASPAQAGAIYGFNGTGWTVRDNLIQLNHGAGVSLGAGMQVLNNRILRQGQLGVGGGDYFAGIVVDGNEIAFNNEAGFNPEWEAGGTKFWATTNLVARGNNVHHNSGPGLWADNDNVGMLYENNLVEDNGWAGIFHEISYAAVIRNNTVRRNGFSDPRGWFWRAGILVAASPDVEISGNIVEDNANAIVGIQQNRGTGALGPRLIRNLWVHDNRVRMQEGQTGLVTDTGDMAIFTSRNNRFDRNAYTLGSNQRYFTWLNGDRTEFEWQAYGLDVAGSFNR
jgi:parallel beta-helix repeat protein